MTFQLKKITPIMQVEAIEPVLSFWTGRLGFQVTAEVPHGDHLGFVIVEKDGYEVMYQTRASVEADAGALAGHPLAGTILFIEVDDIDAIESALADAEVLVPRRTTFYGSTEIFVREPAGNVVGFAQFAASQP
ncbi:MAG TPA: VOC family protein [Longimicrobiales bacterium]